MTETVLTKFQYLRGRQCPKRLWLETYRSESAPEPSPGLQRRFQQNRAVVALAYKRFPEGFLIARHDAVRAVGETKAALEGGADCLFNAAFQQDNLLLHCDILRRRLSGAWELIEVKSSSSAKPKHYPALALQRYMLEMRGLVVEKCVVMHLNPDCRFPELEDLLTTTDVTEKVGKLLDEIPERIKSLQTVLSGAEEPEQLLGGYCVKPYVCPYKAYCWQDVPENSVYTIPGLYWKDKTTLAQQGILHLRDVPEDSPLKPKQWTYVQCVRQQRPLIQYDAIRAALAELKYPIYFLDFETDNPAIPRFKGVKPNGAFPFQYSCHIRYADHSIEHREYLHPDESDPHRPLAESLLAAIGDTGSIVAYKASIEKGVLERLAERFPEHAPVLKSMSARLWDLLDIFRNWYCHPDFYGSNSLKNVLPVLVPKLSYTTLKVQNGSDAPAFWQRMIRCNDEDKKQQLMTQLRAYCELDTMAMVEIHRRLQEI